MRYELPELPYGYAALEPYIDARTMEIHHTKHHQTYVDKLNAALEKHPAFASAFLKTSTDKKASAGKPEMQVLEEMLKNLEAVPENIRKAVRNHGGGHHNHSLFWTVMAPAGKGGGGKPEGALAEEISQVWSSFEKFKEEFTNAALNIFGSGWAWLDLYESKLRICTTPNQDSLLTEGKIPLLGLDVWEHAYYVLYTWNRAEYIKNWWNVVNWSEVERRYKEAK